MALNVNKVIAMTEKYKDKLNDKHVFKVTNTENPNTKAQLVSGDKVANFFPDDYYLIEYIGEDETKKPQAATKAPK